MSRKIESQTSNEKTYYLHQRNIKIYPVNVGQKMYIEVNNNGKIKRFDKVLKQTDVNDALAKTFNYYYNLLKENEQTNQIR
jgi:hypothetical protein